MPPKFKSPVSPSNESSILKTQKKKKDKMDQVFKSTFNWFIKNPPILTNEDSNKIKKHVRLIFEKHSPPRRRNHVNAASSVELDNEVNMQQLVKKKKRKRLMSIDLGTYKKIKVVEILSGERNDLPVIPPIEDFIFFKMAIGFRSNNLQWEKLEYFGDSVIGHCLLKIAKEQYLGQYTAGQIRRGAQMMESNKILAAYTLALRQQEPNGMKFDRAKKFHADAFEAYIGAYYLVYGESPTCRYLKDLMIPLFNLIIEKLQNYPKDAYIVASNYFSMGWICDPKLLD
ncbi:ribonuclease 3 [Gigaspora margarita]|uniref:Ribonuclease 3 n=1 Tax=Gigaspora margarita TaxID=4874 RepID=A0A8H4AWE9_GIGMA|nr:ribonuclease 3 [Gigaspora margarita]